MAEIKSYAPLPGTFAAIEAEVFGDRTRERSTVGLTDRFKALVRNLEKPVTREQQVADAIKLAAACIRIIEDIKV
jgi:hypothetical protein